MSLIRYNDIENHMLYISKVIGDKYLNKRIFKYIELVKSREPIAICFLNYQVLINRIRKFCRVTGKDYIEKYNYLFEEHIKLYPRIIRFTNKIYNIIYHE